MKLWLDDIRKPPDSSWTWVKTAEACIEALRWQPNDIIEMSLDHDLGACPSCLGGRTPEQWLDEHEMQSMPNCDHFGTGYTVICWMEEQGVLPACKPRVHSMNASGRLRMQQVIEKLWGGGS